jgi:hypothetical protein
MTIKFLHMPLEWIDQFCKEHENELVMVSVECYKRVQVTHDTGSIVTEEWPTSSFGVSIRSSKDLFQFDDSDMKIMSDHVKHSLR